MNRDPERAQQLRLFRSVEVAQVFAENAEKRAPRGPLKNVTDLRPDFTFPEPHESDGR